MRISSKIFTVSHTAYHDYLGDHYDRTVTYTAPHNCQFAVIMPIKSSGELGSITIDGMLLDSNDYYKLKFYVEPRQVVEFHITTRNQATVYFLVTEVYPD